MTRPEGMTRVTWASVQLVLEVIAQSYPKAFPSQRRISDRTGIPIRSVQRYIALARAAELLVVEADAGAQAQRSNGSKTNRYWVKLAPSDAANLAPEENTSSYGGGSVTPSQKTSSSVPSSGSASGLAAPEPSEPPRSTVVGMREWQEERSRDVTIPAAPEFQQRSKHPVRPDPDALVEKHGKKRGSKRPPKPPPKWRKITTHFLSAWLEMTIDTGRHKDTRAIESVNQCRTYIEAHFKERSELEVCQMIDEFVTGVSKGHITLKPTQSAWMCFTGAWGRGKRVDTGDIYDKYRSK